MYITTKKADNDRSYVYVVVSKRKGGVVRQETIAYLGALDNDSLPYLRAAFMKKENRPLLVEREKKDA